MTDISEVEAGAAPAPVPDTGRLAGDGDEREARLRVRVIRKGLLNLQATIIEVQKAYKRRDWETLGHPDWASYVAVEYGERALDIPKAQRQEIISQLADSMSTRSIAAVLGIGQRTVVRALPSGESNDSPRTGADGKSYPARKPRQPRPAPAETAEPAAWDEPEPATLRDILAGLAMAEELQDRSRDAVLAAGAEEADIKELERHAAWIRSLAADLRAVNEIPADYLREHAEDNYYVPGVGRKKLAETTADDRVARSRWLTQKGK